MRALRDDVGLGYLNPTKHFKQLTWWCWCHN